VRTTSPLTRWLGAAALAGAAAVTVLGLVVTPEDAVQEEAVRLMYVHVPVATMMTITALLTSVVSGIWLWKRTAGWDALAAGVADIGTLFTALALATGMVWGKPTWGAYWVWDARLTSTALLFVLFLGYGALRRYPVEHATRSKLSAIVGVLLAPNALIVHYSVDWWRSLHQEATIQRLDATIDGLQLFTLMLSLVTGLVLAGWLLVHRFRVNWLEAKAEASLLDQAIERRRNEGGEGLSWSSP
jgi:heme exporter protein C